jgi:5-oxoprolinase (ATP-hydrolysing)
MAAPDPAARIWRLFVDTGGTFTDCLGLDPEGRLHRAKVLSSSSLRARIAAVAAPDRLRLDAPWEVPAGFFTGCTVRLLEGGLDGEIAEVAVAGDGPEGFLRLAGPLAGAAAKIAIGAVVELRSPEEAPVLAARLLTGTPPPAPLPPLALRLATTRGTNALLERKGAATAFFVTAGFADLLRIGTQQRPDLFALDIQRPEALYGVVVEVPERLAADGSVLRPLDGAALEAMAAEARRLVGEGFEAAAVALLHSFRNPAHEKTLGKKLLACGFRHVSLSCRLAPLIQILPRAETAVADAYLSGVLASYLEGVGRAMSGGTLHVMTSAGGLVRAGSFHAKDSLLSGPAGGVVGAARAGRRSGFSRLLAFDMGGTSTDVARFDGDFEYVFEHRVGDARLVAPALAVESVAAGGGSVCRFDGDRLRVGPESTGARPGPACYGLGGPLTLTDVNLLLGRLAPERFEIPLDRGAAMRAFEEVLTALADGEEPTAPITPIEPPPPIAPFEVLRGLLEIANERMADAIRRISLSRGYDPAEYALVAFGGAGAQHACAVAELLGIATVLVPEDAGLLSAAGLMAAVVERFAQRQVLAPLAEIGEGLWRQLVELGEQAAAAVAEEGVPAGDVEVRRRIADLRFAGQETTVAVEVGPETSVEEAFRSAYRDLYGYEPEERPIEVVSLRAVASSRPEPEEPPAARVRSVAAEPVEQRRVCFDVGWREVPVYDRGTLAGGASFAGPCLVLERHSATVVGEGWTGRVDGAGALVLARSGPPLGSPGV